MLYTDAVRVQFGRNLDADTLQQHGNRGLNGQNKS